MNPFYDGFDLAIDFVESATGLCLTICSRLLHDGGGNSLHNHRLVVVVFFFFFFFFLFFFFIVFFFLFFFISFFFFFFFVVVVKVFWERENKLSELASQQVSILAT